MKRCIVPYCKREMIPRKEGIRGGQHHKCCRDHLPYQRLITNFKRDIHRAIAFGQHKQLKDIRCRGCRNSLLDHWNKHCRFLYKDIELSPQEKRKIAFHLFQVDHINGRRRRDYNSPKNLQILCSNCHDVKTKFCGDLGRSIKRR
jgi:hypothetical protein